MKVGGFILHDAEIGAEGIEAVLQFDDAQLFFRFLAFGDFELVEGIGQFLFLGFDLFGQAGFGFARLIDELLHTHYLLAQQCILLMRKSQLFRILSLRVAAAQREEQRAGANA